VKSKYHKILITGASKGIGRQLALDYGKAGASLWLLARSQSTLESLVEEINVLGGKGHFLVCDATQENELIAAFEIAQSSSGGFDLVIANAGWGGKMSYPSENNLHVLNQVIDLNFRAATQTLEYFAKYMVEAGHGHLVGVSSIAGFRGLPGSAPYSATKAALTTYLESLRFSVQRSGVRVTDIRPGFVRTPMTDKNTIPMPFLLEVEVASKKIQKAIQHERKRFTFPWQMAVFVHIVKAFPDFLYDWLVGLFFSEMATEGRTGKSEENLPS
jgi:short-subunit dehydrogenase